MPSARHAAKSACFTPLAVEITVGLSGRENTPSARNRSLGFCSLLDAKMPVGLATPKAKQLLTVPSSWIRFEFDEYAIDRRVYPGVFLGSDASDIAEVPK